MQREALDTDGVLLQVGDVVRATNEFDEAMVGRTGVVENVEKDGRGLVGVRLSSPLRAPKPELIMSAAFLWKLEMRPEGDA